MSDAEFPITIYHNADCGTSRNTLAMIRAAGYDPHVVEYLKQGWSRALIDALLCDMDMTPRALLRAKGTPAAEFGLTDPATTDEAIIDAMLAHPILVNRPIVVTPLGTKLCRPSEVVLEFLERKPDSFTKEDGDVVQLYRLHFPSMLKFAFPELHADQPLEEAWHIDVVADALAQCQRGSGARLIINLPPRHLKSFCTTIAWPLFMASLHPGLKITIVAGTQGLATDFSDKRRKLLQSRRFQQVFPDLKVIRDGETVRFRNGSEIVQTFVGCSQVGRGADFIIIDDPLTPTAGQTEAGRKRVNDWYAAEIVPRLNSRGAGILVVMQRLHLEDLCGHILSRSEKWNAVVLPAIAVRDEAWSLSDGRLVPRSKRKVLCPDRDSRDDLRAQLDRIGGLNFAAQYQQDPRAGTEHRSYFQGPRSYDGWKPGMPTWGGGGLYTTTIAQDLAKELFDEGIEDEPPGLRPWTRDEWQAAAKIQQRELIERCRRSD